ncbi:MAG TPA: hypothetical protein VNW99_02900 [Cytophagaceae bacterium]|nr:hypothetical protein [Cytophagaceae bacterium]
MDLPYKEKPLPPESDANELEKTSSLETQYLWGNITTLGNKVILEKSYFKDIEGSKMKNLILKTVEVNFDGSIANIKFLHLSTEKRSLKEKEYLKGLRKRDRIRPN